MPYCEKASWMSCTTERDSIQSGEASGVRMVRRGHRRDLVKARQRKDGTGEGSKSQRLLSPGLCLPLACQTSQPLCCRRCMCGRDH